MGQALPQSPHLARTPAIMPKGAAMSFIDTIREDIGTVKTHDPAAQSDFVIFLSYPGLHAKWMHTPEHWLWNHGARGPARVLSQVTRFFTGVEIHPAAQLGRRFFIDHAMGVVIGETTVVGDDCVLYQGVTLGGTGKECGKRHPTLGNNVKVGGNSVVVKDVPENCTVVGIPGRVVRRNGCRIVEETYNRNKHRESMPDPVEEQSRLNREGIRKNHQRIGDLEKQVADMERQLAELTELVNQFVQQQQKR